MNPMKIRMFKANLKSGPLKTSTLWRTEACGDSLDYEWPVSSLPALQGNIRSKVTTGDNLHYNLTSCFLSNKLETETNKKNLRARPP